MFFHKIVFFLFVLLSAGIIVPGAAWAKKCNNYEFNNLDFKDDGNVEFNRNMWVAPHYGPILLRLPKEWKAHFEIISDEIEVKDMAKVSMKKNVSGNIIVDLPKSPGVILGTWAIGPTLSPTPGSWSSWSRLLKFKLSDRFQIIDSYTCKKKSGIGTVYKEKNEAMMVIEDSESGVQYAIGETSVYRIKNDILRDEYEATLLNQENTYEIR